MEVTTEVSRLLLAINGEMSRASLQNAMGLKNAEHFRKTYLVPALSTGLVEMTLADKPNSKNQRYRLTRNGEHWLRAAPNGREP